jgi:arylsulfatase A
MSRRALLGGAGLGVLSHAAVERAVRRPNIVVILGDDMGWWDVSCFGHPSLRTPHLDSLAERGMRFTSCYCSAPWCSPSRAGLLTGRHPYRAGVMGAIMLAYGPNAQHLDAREATLPKLLKAAGYDTCHVGKWHLIGKKGDPTPNDHGFDHAFWTEQDARPLHLNPRNFIRNRTPAGETTGLSAQICTGEAIGWLKRRPDPNRPFFLNFWTHEAHSPIATTQEYIDRYIKKNRRNPSIYYGDISHMDDAVGMLVKTLEESGQLDNTFIFFMADNGYEQIAGNEKEIDPRQDFNHGNAGPLRYWKGHCYEGGIRVPGIAFWPGGIKPGSVSDEPVSNLDLLPTICAAAGAPPPRRLDGVNLMPLLRGGRMQRKRPLFWWSGGRDAHVLALRDGDWKLLATRDFQDLELYNLRDDIGEKRNVLARFPAVRDRLLKSMHGWVEDVDEDFRKATGGYPPGGFLIRDAGKREEHRQNVWAQNFVTTL